jgi:hypothetical protein
LGILKPLAARLEGNTSIRDCKMVVIVEKINIFAITDRKAMREDGNENAIFAENVF